MTQIQRVLLKASFGPYNKGLSRFIVLRELANESVVLLVDDATLASDGDGS